MHIQDLLPKPHPSKAIFKNHGVTISSVARALGLSYTYTSNLLNGHHRITPAVDEKLCHLATEIQGEVKS